MLVLQRERWALLRPSLLIVSDDGTAKPPPLKAEKPGSKVSLLVEQDKVLRFNVQGFGKIGNAGRLPNVFFKKFISFSCLSALIFPSEYAGCRIS